MAVEELTLQIEVTSEDGSYSPMVADSGNSERNSQLVEEETF